MRSALITGDAGFIGFHLAEALLSEGFRVTGYDGMTPYYDVSLKESRRHILKQHPRYVAHTGMLEDDSRLAAAFEEAKPDVVIHLAAQAGVRYSLENPRAYLDSNIIGSFNLLAQAKRCKAAHLLMASTSSAYGANDSFPFRERDPSAHPLTIYAATKLAGEAMAHAEAHLYGLPVTIFRFFTVYGPWGRPDMALFKFVKAIKEERAIDVYNNGDMARDFTYVDDIVQGLRRLMDCPPPPPGARAAPIAGDSLSPAAPWRVVNIGAGAPVSLMDFIEAIEAAMGRKALKNFLPMQAGDVPRTWADCALLEHLTGFRPQTDVKQGVKRFVAWHKSYYGA